jgi:hypothetical protein
MWLARRLHGHVTVAGAPDSSALLETDVMKSEIVVGVILMALVLAGALLLHAVM